MNVCNFGRHKCKTVWLWHINVETCRSIYCIKRYSLIYIYMYIYKFIILIVNLLGVIAQYTKISCCFYQESNCSQKWVISGFCRQVAENCALLRHYAASIGNLSPTFQDNISAPFSGFNNAWTLRMGQIDCPET
jgi:hypothetical protein